jgi:hypothetical protein
MKSNPTIADLEHVFSKSFGGSAESTRTMHAEYMYKLLIDKDKLSSEKDSYITELETELKQLREVGELLLVTYQAKLDSE